MPLLNRVSVLAAKIETTIGDPIAVTASDATFTIFDAQLQPNIDFQERSGQGGMSPLPGVPGARGATITFATELKGDGAAGVPAWASTFLPACGYVASGNTFSPASEAAGTNVKTLTIARYVNGLRESISGAMGTFKIMLPAGRVAMIEFTFTGLWITPTDATILAPTYNTIAPLRFASSTITLGGSAITPVESIEIDAGNTVILREDGATLSGYHSALVTTRRVTGSMTPETPLVAAKDWWGVWTGRTEAAFSVIVGSANNQVSLAAPKLQVTNLQEAERNQMHAIPIEFQCNRSSAIGNDELSILFS